MRKIKYFGAIGFIMLFLIACDQNATDGTIYNATNTEVAFNEASANYTFGTDDPEEFEVLLLRANSIGAATIPLVKEDVSGLFTVPTNVEFADGAYEAAIKVSFDRTKLAVGEDYSIKLNVPENPIQGKIRTFTLTINRDYNWQLFATGTFTSGLFGSWSQELYKAEGFNKYKFPELFAEGYDYKFSVAENGSISLFGGLNSNGLYDFVTGYIHPTYDMVSLYLDPDINDSFFVETTKTACFSHYYYVDAGNFGWKDDSFTW